MTKTFFTTSAATLVAVCALDRNRPAGIGN